MPTQNTRILIVICMIALGIAMVSLGARGWLYRYTRCGDPHEKRLKLWCAAGFSLAFLTQAKLIGFLRPSQARGTLALFAQTIVLMGAGKYAEMQDVKRFRALGYTMPPWWVSSRDVVRMLRSGELQPDPKRATGS